MPLTYENVVGSTTNDLHNFRGTRIVRELARARAHTFLLLKAVFFGFFFTRVVGNTFVFDARIVFAPGARQTRTAKTETGFTINVYSS